MSIRIKAVLLSALVLPGLGQLYKGDKVKGALFIILANIFLLLALWLVLRGMGSFLLTARTTGTSAAMQTLETIRQNSPEIGWLLAGLSVLWGVAVVDAAIAKPSSQESPPDQ